MTNSFKEVLASAHVHARALVEREAAEAEADARKAEERRTEQAIKDAVAAESSRRRALLDRAKRVLTDQHEKHRARLQAKDIDHHVRMVEVIRASATAAIEGQPTASHANGATLSICFAEFAREKASGSAWNAKTRERWEFTFRTLLEGLGDRPVAQVKRRELVDFIERLRRLPSNARKMPALAGKTFAELTEISGFEVLGDGTVNDFMGRVSSFFKWARKVEEYGLRANPAEGLTVRNPVRASRRPFNDNQMVALFSHASFRTRRFLHPHHFWLMTMSILTGMRLNELCQLHLADFVEVAGVAVIRCADLGEGQRVKNANATRQVPVHSELVRLGLLRWVNEQRAAGRVQLFPELKPGRDGYGQGPSKWFGRYRKACGITTKQTAVFHSFRHHFISERLNAGVPPHLIAALVGHETGLITGDVYWSDRDAGALLDVVNKLALPAGIAALVPTIEQVQFVKVPRRPPSRAGASKSRQKRMTDAAARKATDAGCQATR